MLDKSHRDSPARDPQCGQSFCDLTADGRRGPSPFSARGTQRNRGRRTEWNKCPWPINVEEEQESLSQQLSPDPHLF